MADREIWSVDKIRTLFDLTGKTAVVTGGSGAFGHDAAKGLAAFGANALETIAGRADLPGATALSGIYDFRGDADAYAGYMARWLKDSDAGTVLMCHPGDADEAAADDPIAPAREREAQFLASARIAEQLAQHHIQLVKGSTLFSPTT